MRYRQLGSSDLNVSEISLGSWLTYGGGVADDQARACVDAAFEAGINFIDTANVYALGAAEEFLGEVLASPAARLVRARDEALLPDGRHGENEGLSRGQVLKQIDESLRRLRTDYVDLYQCHRYDSQTPLEETMEALDRGRRGRARRATSASASGRPAQIQAALDLVARARLSSSSSRRQPQYSLLWREPEREVIPLCAENGISQIVWSPLAQGVADRQVPARRAGRPKARGRRASGWAG